MSTRQLTIAIDAMGGENSPFKTLKGSEIFSTNHQNLKLIFFGNKANIKEVINTNKLGTSFQSEEAFENKDASPLIIDTDMLNHKRNTSNPMVGPFESIKEGRNYIKIFTAKR